MSFAKSHNGLIHLICPLSGGEFTMCGDAFDIDENTDHSEDGWRNTDHGPVTCQRCAEVIKACRGVRIATKEERSAG